MPLMRQSPCFLLLKIGDYLGLFQGSDKKLNFELFIPGPGVESDIAETSSGDDPTHPKVSSVDAKITPPLTSVLTLPILVSIPVSIPILIPIRLRCLESCQSCLQKLTCCVAKETSSYNLFILRLGSHRIKVKPGLEPGPLDRVGLRTSAAFSVSFCQSKN